MYVCKKITFYVHKKYPYAEIIFERLVNNKKYNEDMYRLYLYM